MSVWCSSSESCTSTSGQRRRGRKVVPLACRNRAMGRACAAGPHGHIRVVQAGTTALRWGNYMDCLGTLAVASQGGRGCAKGFVRAIPASAHLCKLTSVANEKPVNAVASLLLLLLPPSGTKQKLVWGTDFSHVHAGQMSFLNRGSAGCGALWQLVWSLPALEFVFILPWG